MCRKTLKYGGKTDIILCVSVLCYMCLVWGCVLFSQTSEATKKQKAELGFGKVRFELVNSKPQFTGVGHTKNTNY